MDFLKHLFETLPDIVYLIDTQGRLVHWNRRLEQVTGYTSLELQGKYALEFFPAEERPKAQAAIEEAFARGYKREQLKFLCKDGTVIDYEYDGVPFVDEEGQVQGLTGIGRDISQLKEAWERIEHLAAFPRENPNPVLELNRKGEITYQNESAQRLLDELGKRTFSECFPECGRELIEACLDSGEPRRDLESQVGSKIVSMSFFPIEAKEVVHCYAIDVTEKREMEKRLGQSHRLESLGNLAAGVAHELNNALAPIRMVTDLLRRRLGDQGTVDYLQRIDDSVERSTSLLKHLLTFARGEAGEMTDVDVRTVLKSLQDTTLTILPLNIRVEVSADPDLSYFRGNPTQLHQVLTNLVINARDAMPEGGRLTIEATNLSVGQESGLLLPPGSYVLIEVHDTGTGIAPEIADKIIEPFYSTKQPGEGTGLGLSISRGILETHGGTLSFESQVGQGSTFKVFLPSAGQKQSVLSQERQKEKYLGKGQKILLVDDEATIRQLVAEWLHQHEYYCITAAHGLEALEIFSKHRKTIDIVISDLFMPYMGAIEFIRSLKALKPEVRIVAASGHLDSEWVERLKQEGINRYIAKPFDKEHLLSLLQKSD